MSVRGIDVIGVEFGGLVSSLFNAAGAAVDIKSQSQAEKADADKVKAAITADQAATNAVGRANTSEAVAKLDPSKANTAKADKMAADAAVKVQDKAGAVVPESKRADRVKAAQDAVDTANQDVQDALRSSDKAKQMSAQAWLDAANQTLGKAQGTVPEGNTGAGKGGKGAGASTSFLSSTLYGPIKWWEAIVAAVVAGGGVYLWKRK